MTREEFNKQVQDLMDSYLRANYPEVEGLEGKVSCLSEEDDYLEKLKQGQTVTDTQVIATYLTAAEADSMKKSIENGEYPTSAKLEGKIVFGNDYSVLSRGPENKDYVLVETVTDTYPWWRLCEGEVMLFCMAGEGYIVCEDSSGTMHYAELSTEGEVTFFMQKGDKFLIVKPPLYPDAVVCIVSDTSMETTQAIQLKPGEMGAILLSIAHG